jgi:zinc protease
MTANWPPGRIHTRRLANGLRVLALENRDAPVVTSALTYRVGARDDPEGATGLAHFLEHMMFKGSAGWAAGEVDRRTLALGGSNNAFTGHDASTYYFSFARDCWEVALEIEADRMAGLTLAAAEVESERGVILEEIAMYRAEPWDALDRAVQEKLFGRHPYGRQVIGATRDVRRITAEQIEALHRETYRPDNAVLVVAGGVTEYALDRAADLFEQIPRGRPARRTPSPAEVPVRLTRVDVERGETSRLLLAFPCCRGNDEDHPALKLLAAVLGSGRASRMNRRLVDEEELCAWVSADAGESELPGSFAIAAELLPGTVEAAVEEALLEELEALLREPVSATELSRARRVLLADWVFDHEHVQRQALTLSQAAAVFDADHPADQIEAISKCDSQTLAAVARRYLDVEGGSVLGWSRPAGARRQGVS